MTSALEVITEQGIVAIVRSASPDEARNVVALLVNAGVRAVEVSLVTPGALDVIRDAVANAPDGVEIGVGTALTSADVEAAVLAGASFVVSPVVREPVVRAAIEAGVVVLPGAATPSEALSAVEWGAPLVKIFPASLWTPSVLREVLAAMPYLRTVPTGGVQASNAGDWIRAGAVAVGIGSALSKAQDPAAAVEVLLESIESARAAR